MLNVPPLLTEMLLDAYQAKLSTGDSTPLTALEVLDVAIKWQAATCLVLL